MSDALRICVLAAADALDAARSELGILDGAAGDGDHGMTMSIGARNVRRRLQALPSDTSPGDLLRAIGLAMADVGGAIGPLYSAAIGAMAAELDQGPAGGNADLARLHRAAAAAETAIVDLGHAVPGDKTLIDALHPFVLALGTAEASSPDLDAAVAQAVDASATGALSTADMVARVGRASRLGDRSRGLPDAGATSFSIIVRAMADAYRGARTGHG